MWALHHLAAVAPPAALARHRELLLDAAVRGVAAADERLWPAAAPAACALIVALEGARPDGSACLCFIRKGRQPDNECLSGIFV